MDFPWLWVAVVAFYGSMAGLFFLGLVVLRGFIRGRRDTRREAAENKASDITEAR